MHIPDGFISPYIYVPAALVDVALLSFSFKKLKSHLEDDLPKISVLTALSFVLMSITFPIIGGTSVHITGIPILSILFGPWVAFFCSSLVLFIQAVFFGEGGITTFPINSLVMSFTISFVSYFLFERLKNINRFVAIFLASFISLVLAALILAFILGIHPLLFHTIEGKPLYFPFGLEITIPALVIPHLFAGIIEGIFTISVYNYIAKKGIK